MRGRHVTKWRMRVALRCGTAILALAATPSIASAEPENPADTAAAPVAPVSAPIEETSRYPMRLMMQVFDGNQEFSHTQVVGFARMRHGDESWVMVNFGDGAVQIDTPGKTAASAFRNTSGTESALRYDYATKTLISGDGATNNYHNAFVRPQLGRGPALGANARWTTAMMLEQLGLVDLGAQPLSIELSREYFEHGGRPYVLVHYRVPSFGYQSNGRAIVQWAEGVALTDPGFGHMYWSATLSRAVAAQGGTSARPYRFAKSMTALGEKGAPMIDVRAIPQLAPYLARFHGKAEDAVSGFVKEGVAADQNPITIAGNIDIMALSMAEDSANQLGEVTDAYLTGNRGDEVASGVGNFAAAIQGMAAGVRLNAQEIAAVNEAFAAPASKQAVAAQMNRILAANPENSATIAAQLKKLDGLVLGVRDDPAMDGQGAAFNAMVAQIARSVDGSGGIDTQGAAFNAMVRSMSGGGMDKQGEAFNAMVRNSPVMGKLDQIDQLMRSLNQEHQQAETRARVQGMIALLQDRTISAVDGGVLAAIYQRADSVGTQIVTKLGAVLAAVSGSSLPTSIDLSDKALGIIAGLETVVPKTIALTAELDGIAAELNDTKIALQAALAASPTKVIMSDAYLALKAMTDAQLTEIQSFNAIFESSRRTGAAVAPGMVTYYYSLLDTYEASLRTLSAAAKTGVTTQNSVKVQALETVYGVLAERVTKLTAQLEGVGREASLLGRALKTMKVEEIAAVAKRISASPLGKTIGRVSVLLDLLTINSAITNIVTGVTTNVGSGKLPLTRNYDEDGGAQWFMLGLEIGAMGANYASGNKTGFATGSAALLLGSISDLFVSAKGAVQVRKIVADAEAETARLQARLAQMRQDQLALKLAAIEKDGPDFMAEMDRQDKVSSDLNSEMLRQIAERRAAKKAAEAAAAAAAEREAKAEIARQVAEAKRQNELEYQRNLKRPPTAAEWAKFDRDIADAIKPDYPTAPPLSVAEATARIAAAKLKARLAAEREAAEVADRAAAALAAVEAEKAAKRAASEKSIADANDAIARRAYQAALDKARRDERGKSLEISSLEFEPVTFKPPVWDPPVWKPPVWIPPEFDAPETSEIGWTDFDDDDYPGAKGNLAFKFESMSGKVATDLAPYADWLATQDVRQLTRLALQAGYPNLASALADSKNLVAQSQDTKYRQWALQQPSCGGYTGCGPSFLERWSMKQSVVALGDILADSRGIFSSGGLSDIGISGQNLSYLLRDFGIEDGDIVQIKISQFSKVIYSGRLTLKNAGSAFAIALQRGVAVLEIFAENEGYSSPNTAEIKVDNVVRGESTQSYSLNTGETATLRINSGEKR